MLRTCSTNGQTHEQVSSSMAQIAHTAFCSDKTANINAQEAQLPQRMSAAAISSNSRLSSEIYFACSVLSPFKVI